MSEIPENMSEVDEEWLFSLLQNDRKFETDKIVNIKREPVGDCLLYTSDAADDP